MPVIVTNGALITCSFGTAPAALQVLPVNRVLAGGAPAATIADNVPVLNVPPFGMCSSAANPAVASATAAALGVLTPMPCVPATPAPWIPGAPTVVESEIPMLDNNCSLHCLWGGVIQVSFPGQATVMSG